MIASLREIRPDQAPACTRWARVLALGATLALLGAGGVRAQEGFACEARIEGVDDPDILALLEGLSETLSKRDQPPASLIHLERRTGRDREAFVGALRARAHYGATVEVRVDAQVQPVEVVFSVTPGSVYTVKKVHVVPADEGVPLPALPEPEALGLTAGAPAYAQAILDAEGKTLEYLREGGYPFPEVVHRKVLVDHADTSVTVTYTLAPGPGAHFGETRIEGLESVREDVVRERITWRTGLAFKASLLKSTRQHLYQTNLFSMVRISPGDRVEEDGSLAMTISLSERKHRTIGAGLEFHTDTGVSLSTRWEHRNVHGRGRKLTLRGVAGQVESGLRSTYLVPRFRREDQTLSLHAEAIHESPEAYTSQRIAAGAWVERQLDPTLSAGLGLSLRLEQIEQNDAEESYNLISMPAQLRLDRTDDALDAKHGFRATLRAEPFVDLFDPGLVFLKTELSLSHYLPLSEDAGWLLATRLRLGALAGAGRSQVPADVRFYAGGGGSVRGFAYQTAGPLDGDDDPLGGRSAFEAAIELRRRISETLGFVVFLDAGSAYAASYPDFAEPLRYGAGAGLRYFTPIGPLRFDVAVPLNRRDSDDSFQIYVSLGQAF